MGSRNVYLVFSKTETWLSKVIRTLTTIKYVHTSISFDDSFDKMYSFGRINPDNPFSAGFVEEDLHKGVYHRSHKCECLIYKLTVTDEQYESLWQQVKSFEREKEHLHYNFLGLFGVMFQYPLKRKDSYFCSQFVGKLLQDNHVIDCDKQPELITSEDLLRLKNRDVIWEGHIRDFIAYKSREVVGQAV